MTLRSPAPDGAIPLWPRGVPQPDGVAPKEVPALVPYLPETRGRRGAIIVCPGGGYRCRAAHEDEPIARWLNLEGIAAFVLRYRVYPHRHPAPLMDLQRAIRMVRHHAVDWNLKPDRVGTLGFSAGGHLVSTAATHFGATAAPLQPQP